MEIKGVVCNCIGLVLFRSILYALPSTLSHINLLISKNESLVHTSNTSNVTAKRKWKKN